MQPGVFRRLPPRLVPRARLRHAPVSDEAGVVPHEVGQVLELLATDPGVEPDMNAWTRRTGNELVGITQDAGVFHVLIRRAR